MQRKAVIRQWRASLLVMLVLGLGIFSQPLRAYCVAIAQQKHAERQPLNTSWEDEANGAAETTIIQAANPEAVVNALASPLMQAMLVLYSIDLISPQEIAPCGVCVNAPPILPAFAHTLENLIAPNAP